jgi:CrcB protein
MLLARWLPHQNARLLVITGFLGGYDLFELRVRVAPLWERGKKGLSLGYIASTLVGGLLAVTLGVALARELTVPKAERAGAETQAEETSNPSASESGGTR